MEYNGETYKTNYQCLCHLDKHFLVDFKEAEEKYIRENRITSEQIQERALMKGICINPYEYSPQREEIEISLIRERNSRAKNTWCDVAKTWGQPEPIPGRWYAVYTSWGNIEPAVYKTTGWNIQLGNDCTPEVILTWTPVEIVQTVGKEVNGIYYVGFPEWRFKKGEVMIYPLDKLKFRLNSNKLHHDLFAQSHSMTMEMLLNGYRVRMNEILEIELDTIAPNDTEQMQKQAELVAEKEEKFETINKIVEDLTAEAKELLDIMKGVEENQEKLEAAFMGDPQDPSESEIEILMEEKARLERNIGRASGRTTRIVNCLVEKFYNEPMGTYIPILDHYFPDITRIDSHIIRVLKERLRGETNYKIVKKAPEEAYFYLVRTEKTYQETLQEQIAEIDNKIEQLMSKKKKFLKKFLK